MIALVFSFFIQMALCLKILELRVPDLLDVQAQAILSCKYDLDGEPLFSVKWYKDEDEFFRYMPSDRPSITGFPVKGVHLATEQCNETTVVLDRLEYVTTGTYKCEVSTEAPHFKTALGQSNMTVLGLPREDPLVQGVLPTYAVGDYVTANCTSSPSYPPAIPTWYINEDRAEKWYLTQYNTPKSRHYLGQESRTVGIKFQADISHFLQKEGILTLTCSATVAGLTRRRVTTSYLAKLMNEKFAQEQMLKNKGSSISQIWTLLWVCVISVKWTFKLFY